MKAFGFLFTLIVALGGAVCLCILAVRRLKKQVAGLAAVRPISIQM